MQNPKPGVLGHGSPLIRGSILCALLAVLPLTVPAKAFAQAQNCADVYFIGVHGVRQGPDDPAAYGQPVDKQPISYELIETLGRFKQEAARVGKIVDYTLLSYHAPQDFIQFLGTYDDVHKGTLALNQVITGVLARCPTQNFVLVGYSFGAWVVNDWINGQTQASQAGSLNRIKAIELYGDPLWEHWANDLGANSFYAGVAQFGAENILNPRPYEGASPQGLPGISDRWQSRCLSEDPICGEGYKMTNVTTPKAGQSSYLHQPQQFTDAFDCPTNVCPHLKYTIAHTYSDKGEIDSCNYGRVITNTTGQKICDEADSAPTTRGAYWLALKSLPLVPTSANPEIVQVETFREGALVFFRVFFTNPNNATGFGFESTDLHSVAQENPTWAQPSYGRVSREVSPAKIEYPVNLGCTDSGSPDQVLSLYVWINYGNGQNSRKELVDISCSAPSEEVTPFQASSAIR